MKQIAIDLEVNRAIEAGRLSFEETENAILRRLLGIDARPAGAPRQRLPRSSGAYMIVMGNRVIEANSLKEFLRRAILMAEKMRPGLIETLAQSPTARGRHMVASSPDLLYPKAPQLLSYAERLDGDWWYDTNVGRNQVQAYLRTIARLTNLPNLPTIQKRTEKSVLTLEDLGLA